MQPALLRASTAEVTTAPPRFLRYRLELSQARHDFPPRRYRG